MLAPMLTRRRSRCLFSWFSPDLSTVFWFFLRLQVRVVLKYRHCDGNLCIKVTDNVVCLQYKTDQAQDVKKIEKAPREADETDGVQGDSQRRHGDGLNSLQQLDWLQESSCGQRTIRVELRDGCVEGAPVSSNSSLH
uniref:SRP9 domain-containing protein n=1 Tax=Salarias fasciatus TaxID=181472 RepID=A0A672FGH2_SALFA